MNSCLHRLIQTFVDKKHNLPALTRMRMENNEFTSGLILFLIEDISQQKEC